MLPRKAVVSDIFETIFSWFDAYDFWYYWRFALCIIPVIVLTIVLRYQFPDAAWPMPLGIGLGVFAFIIAFIWHRNASDD